MYTEDYEKLHREYVAKMIEYHNLYLAYIHGGKSKAKNQQMRNILKELVTINKALIKESLAVRKKKIDLYKDHYQTQRIQGGDASRFHKHDVDTSGDDS